MFLDLHLHRGRQPALVLAFNAVIESGLAITGLSIPSGTTELTAGRQLFHHVVARDHLSSEQFFVCCSARESNSFAPGIHTENNFLSAMFCDNQHLDGEGCSTPYFRKALLQQMLCFCGRTGHQGAPIFRKYKY